MGEFLPSLPWFSYSFTCMYLQVHITSSVIFLIIQGARFAMSVIDNLDIRPNWAKDNNDFMDYFIIATFAICFLGSLPSKITALRYFTFLTAIINLFLGAVTLKSYLRCYWYKYRNLRNIMNIKERNSRQVSSIEKFLEAIACHCFLQ